MIRMLSALSFVPFVLAAANASPLPEEAERPPLGAVFEQALEKKDDAAIEAAFKERQFEVIELVDGYLETWLANVEGSTDKPVDKPERLLELALLAAKHGDVALGGEGYTKYANAWKNWSTEQRAQFREGQKEFYAGRAQQKEKKYDAAREHYQRSLALAEPLGDMWGTAQAHDAIGSLDFGKGELDAAAAHHEQALELWTALRHPQQVRPLHALALIREKQGDLKGARECLEREFQVGVAMKAKPDTLDRGRKELARICRALGDEAAAKKYEAEMSGGGK